MHAVLSASRGCPGRYTALTTRWLATKNNTGAQKQESRSEPLINQAIVSAGFAKLRLIGIDGQQVRTADSLGLRELTLDFRAY